MIIRRLSVFFLISMFFFAGAAAQHVLFHRDTIQSKFFNCGESGGLHGTNSSRCLPSPLTMTGGREKKEIKITDFEGIGDNFHVNDQAFQDAISAAIFAGGGKVKVPAGKYVISTQQKITNCDAPVQIEGDGAGVTVIRQISPTESGFVWDCGSNFSHGGGLSNLTLEAGLGYDAARFTGLGSSAVGVNIKKMVGEGKFTGLAIHNFSQGIALNGGWDNDIEHVRILFFDSMGLSLGVEKSFEPGGGNRIHSLKISNNGFSGKNNASVGMRIGASGGEYISEVEITSTHNGVVISPDYGQATLYLFMEKVAPDTTESDAWFIDSTKGPIYSLNCIECWGAYSGGNGISINGPASNYASLSFTNFRARENARAGVFINTIGAGRSDIEFIAPEIASNSRGRPFLSSGVELARDVNGIKFIGGFVGNRGSFYTDQAYSISCGGGNKFSVIGTNLTPYGTGTAEYGCSTQNEITQYNRDAIIPGALMLGSRTFSTLPECDKSSLGSLAIISDGVDYKKAGYGSAVKETGLVTRKIMCSNSSPSIFLWIYN